MDKNKWFRNIAAHDYFRVDAEEVWQIIKNNLPELRKGNQKDFEGRMIYF